MSLPPGFLDELRARVSLGAVAGRKVVWDQRKSNQGRGDLWAPCPFHQEKSASFHVDDKKGFYYCFGCQAKGDVINFVRETENLGFMEAVALLAQDAGLPMPQRDPQAQQKADRFTRLTEIMEQAVRYYRLQLNSGAGAPARAHLQARDLSPQTVERFEIGFAPGGGGLFAQLQGQGVSVDHLVEVGLLAHSDRGGAPYERFRNRIMFPIRDGRGRCIAFGGRALDPNARAKYLNSPETPLFHKGRTLYNLAPAREAAGKGHPLLVAEGYMDVIALAQYGFEAALAPLGTAITEDQLAMLWRISDEPVLALDGDAAGQRAALRAAHLALPLLAAGKALRFLLMPQGKDPDDLLRESGQAAMSGLIDGALSMSDLLWQRTLGDGQSYDSPERRAALEKALNESVERIQDPAIRTYYARDFKNRLWSFFDPRKGQGAGGTGRKRAGAQSDATPSARVSPLAQGDEEQLEDLRTGIILATLARIPALLPEFEENMAELSPRRRDLAELRNALLAFCAAECTEGTMPVVFKAPPNVAHTLDTLQSSPHVAITPSMRAPEDHELARKTLAHEFEKLAARRGLESEIEEASLELQGAGDEVVTWRLGQAARALLESTRLPQGDDSDYVISDNGVRINRADRQAFEALLARLEAEKPQK